MSEIADRDRGHGHGLERCVKGGLCDPTGHGAIVSPRLRECNFQSTLDILSWIALDCLSLNSDRDGRGASNKTGRSFVPSALLLFLRPKWEQVEERERGRGRAAPSSFPPSLLPSLRRTATAENNGRKTFGEGGRGRQWSEPESPAGPSYATSYFPEYAAGHCQESKAAKYVLWHEAKENIPPAPVSSL